MPPDEYLCFRLWGPMASWGDIAVGEERGSWARPSRSGVLGLVAAAFSFERSNAEAHDRLEKGLGFAVRVTRPGTPLRDYHTSQSPASRKDSRWATRREELAPDNDLNTILSERSYIVDLDTTIVLWRREAAECPSLREIGDKLEQPNFTLYLGRKSCPLGLPVKGHLMTAQTPLLALERYDAQAAEELKLPRRWRSREHERHVEIWLDAQDAEDMGLEIIERTVRRDRVRDRPRWHFADRDEALIRNEEHGS